LRFNLSHTRGLVAVAVTLGADIGVDVEGRRERDTNLDVARRFFAPAEVRHLESVASGRQPQVFLEFWTLKEAYIKATGEGLSADLSSFAMQLSDPPTIAFANGNQAAADEWHFRRLHLTNAHVASLAVRRHGMAPAVVVREVVPTVP
jgi:4'-phosphopantetheinyl transferase